MDFEIITQLIGSLGFPIVACIYLAMREEKTNERHASEMNELRKSVDNNTNVMIKLCTKLGFDVDIKED